MDDPDWVDGNKGKAKTAFEGDSLESNDDAGGSKMVKSDKPYPELRPDGSIAATVKRQRHQDALDTEYDEAKARNDRVTRLRAFRENAKEISEDRSL